MKIRIQRGSGLLFASVFFFSLQSHGPVPWLIALFLLFLFRFVKRCKISRSEIILTCAFFTILLAFAFKFVIYDYLLVDANYSSSFPNNLIMYSSFGLIFLSLRSILNDTDNQVLLVRICRVVLACHIGAFAAQALVWYLGGTYLDFVYPFTGEESRFNYHGYARFSGLQVEPSTYTSVIAVLVALVCLSDKQQRFDTLLLTALLTMVVSLSTAGIVIAALLYIYLTLRNLSASFFLFIAAVLFLAVLPQEVDQLFGNSGAAQIELVRDVDMRIRLIGEISERTGIEVYLANGPFALERDIAILTGDDAGKSRIASINDMGLLVFLLVRLGLFGVLIFFWLLWRNMSSLRLLFLFLIVSLTKLGLFHPLLWIYVAFAFAANKATIKENKGFGAAENS